MRILLPFLAVFGSITLLPAQPAPVSIEAPAGAKLMLEAKGDGAQVYACTDSHWVLKAPDAKLLDAQGQVIGTHFAGPTWRLTDGSEVKGKVIASQPAPDGKSIPWLLLGAVPGSQSGKFTPVAYIRRTETNGGAAPKEPCTSGELPVPYTAKYSFYAK
jgi:FtsP/CotA-like multicopper oxidase with cupredoxin domain